MENEKRNNTGLIITITILIFIIMALVFGIISYVIINNMKNDLIQQANNQIQENNTEENENNYEYNNNKQENNSKEEQNNNPSSETTNVVENSNTNNTTTNTVENSNESTNTNNISTGNTFTPIAGLGDKYVNFDNRSFAVNGKIFTLGVHTLQDMINAGVPFDEKDLANANNNLNKNYESQGFEIVLGKYYSAQVYFSNSSNDNMKISDCKLSRIYFPINNDKEQNILSFAFPLTITEDELVAQAGKPTNESEYTGSNNYFKRTLEYKIDSTKYYGNSGYTFEFLNGKLEYLYISYLE